MLQTLHCIALRTIKYNERHSILSAYSCEVGRVSFLVPAGSGKEALRRRALMMPMSVFECVVDMRPSRDIYNMKDPRADVVLHGIYSHPVKSAVALFIAEFLGIVLRESQEDELLYAFLKDSITRFDAVNDGLANFHICFLLRLGHFIGIIPDMSTYSEGRYFDMVDGTFRVTPPLHSRHLNQEDSSILSSLMRMNYDNMHRFRLSRENRNRILDIVLEYYSIHYASLSSLKSKDVLRELFD